MTKMSRVTVLLLALSRTPPALILLIIIGLAVLVTMMVTGTMSQQEQMERGEAPSSISAMAPVIVSTDKIPEGSTITKQMVKQSRLSERTIWEDAITTAPNAVGRVTKHTIPAYNQIREEDLK